MPTKLSIRPDEADPNQYRVMGLPPGHNALIRFKNGEWNILHTDEPNQSGEWAGGYESADAALAALEAVL
jgi:hypothetical protein